MKRYNTTSPKHNGHGFALVIALSLMAFVLLLLLSLTTGVRVATQLSDIVMLRLEAREKARLAAMQALGRLQQSMGPDQRISFRASMFDSTPDSPTLEGVENPLWTASVPTRDPDSSRDPTEFAEENRSYALGFKTADQIGGSASLSSPEVRWLVSQPNEVSMAPNDPISKTASEIMGGEKTLQIADRKLSDGSGAETFSGESLSVEVGLVPVFNSSGARTGAFGWWVEDEGVKAQFNLEEQIPTTVPEPYDPTLFGTTRARGANFAHSGESDPSFDELQADGFLRRLNSSLGRDLLSEGWSTWFEDRSADIGFGSYAVPVDVVEGRLKEDLTVYLETGAGLDDDDDIIRGGSGDTNFLGSPDYLQSYDNMPKFGILRTWNEIGKGVEADDPTGITINSRPQTEISHGFHSQVWRTGVRIVPVVDGPLPKEGPPTGGPADKDIFLLIAPFVELWNPHAVPIPPEKYLVEIAMPDMVRFGRQPNEINLDGMTNRETLAEVLAEFDLRNMVTKENYNFGDQRAWIKMVIDTGDTFSGGVRGLMPGESVLFSPFPEFPDPADYVDQAAASYSASSDVNLATRKLVDLGSGNAYFRFPQKRTVTLDPTLHYGTDVNFDGSQFDYGQGVYHRLSLLTGGGPELLHASSGLMPDTLDVRRQSAGMAFADSDRGDRLTTSVDWDIRHDRNRPYIAAAKHVHRVARTATATPKKIDPSRIRARHGGTLTISLRNPRQGFLREDLKMPNSTNGGFLGSQNNPSHITTFFNQEAWSSYGRRLATATGPWGNVGAIPTFNDNSFKFPSASTGTVHAQFDFPRQYGPIHSLGQLMHANLNPLPFGPGYVVGYSRAPFATSVASGGLGRDEITQTDDIIPGNDNERVDIAWLVNASVWDRFFLSTIPQSGGFNPENPETVLPNNRMHIIPDADGQYPAAADLRDSETAFEQSASNILVEGAFNVNSTSVEAWKAFLLSKAGDTLNPAFPQNSGGNKTDADTYNPDEDDKEVLFPRFAKPVFGVKDNDEFDNVQPRTSEFPRAGLHVTSREEIERLAEVIVGEIKRRGPFLSMADFINRRLIPDQSSVDGDYIGLMGTLDAAIHRTSQETDMLNYNLIFSDINSSVDAGTTLKPSDDELDERYRAVPAGLAESALEGFPSYLLQADILANLGSQMTVRSDTFTIHGYGETTNPNTGRVEAEARCEMVVQRLAEPVAAGDDIVNPSGKFGRRFVVVAFRWLD